MTLRTILPSALLLTAAALPAQDDLRDRVTRTDGKVVTGRVLVPTAEDELIVVQGGRRTRIPRADVGKLELVADDVREFCRRRVRLGANKRAQWFLVDWAKSHGLEGLARAQATLLALDDDTDEEAHAFLGHKKSPKGWLWELDGKNVLREQFEAAMAKKPWTITGERFAVRSDGGMRETVAALLDLEHLGVEFHQRFGAPLQLQETLQPIVVETTRGATAFQKWGFRPLPYYTPPPHGDVARTFYSGVRPTRPDRLFFVGAEGLLYHSLIGEVDQQSDRDRVCAWLEIGLGMYFESILQGPAGLAAPGDAAAQDRLALQALGRTFRLSSLLHLPMYGGFYLMDDTPTAIHWASAAAFTAWLLDPDNKPATREPFLEFVRQALGEKKGDSSTLFDRVLGRRVEEMEEPFKAWLEKKAGG